MENVRMLLVDDEADFLSAIIKRLNHRGYDVHGAAGGDEALELLQRFEIDVVVMDVKMPGRDGLSLLQEIKDRWPLVEVIMLTGHASVESGIRGMELGAFDYLMKPAKLDELLQKVRQAVERKRLRER
ncbi:response regulator [Desulfonatronum thiodismutans]|uniref:response regulator n=1 Tax=Desulfonatronum thiodismutans TaxID=159290 RepID=UPI0004ABE263|nr:response regulator [Desulfonatronum thiodismutans]